MDLVFGSVRPYGSARSIVRRIGTRLPLAPCPRVRFQLQPFMEGARALGSSRRRSELIASLADVASIDGEDDASTGLRPGSRPGFIVCSHQRQPRRRSSRKRRSLHVEETDHREPSPGSRETIQKISALENELAKLREQIAQIVLAQEQSAQAVPTPTGPGPGPGPGPPPPPPPPLPSLQPNSSAIDLIRERRGKNAAVGPQPEPRGPPEMPSMLEVLKDMGKVKLRAVRRPEGGDTKPSDPTDPAALIADALRRKFAYRYGNESRAEGDGQSVGHNTKADRGETPMFGQHMLKSTPQRNLL
ncbi:mitochondrial fission regulator 1 isoform X1 [Paramormyrops kingsleyae]|uniref:mitochondrial fission regulator 1 isoform X1 n=2 Tax=Paramormyrops kingsleyae TaxID=1676925 RepID=UPI003B96B86E